MELNKFKKNIGSLTAKQEKGGTDGRKIKLGPWKIAAIAAGVILIILVLMRIFGHKEDMTIDPLSTVSVGHAHTGDISVETSLIGTVMPGDVYNVVPKTSGEISEIFVAVGDSVKAGDPICTIDNSKQVDAAKISLDGAEVSLKTAQNAASTAKSNLDRMSVLYESGDISQQAFESAQSGYDQAAAALEGAELSLEGAKLQYDTQLEFSTVTAPADGIVESVSMSINGLAAQTTPVCIISSRGEAKVTFNVTDRLLDVLRTGDAVTVTKHGVDHSGKIITISTLPSQTSGLYQVEAHFEGSEKIVKGSSVKISFVSEKADNALLVDTDDIHYDGGKTYVYTISYNGDAAGTDAEILIAEGNKAGTVHKNEVKTGISNSEFTEIVEGIDAEALIITSWTSQLFEGAQVQVLPEG